MMPCLTHPPKAHVMVGVEEILSHITATGQHARQAVRDNHCLSGRSNVDRQLQLLSDAIRKLMMVNHQSAYSYRQVSHNIMDVLMVVNGG